MKKATISMLTGILSLIFMVTTASAQEKQQKEPATKGQVKKLIIINGDTTVNEVGDLSSEQMRKMEIEMNDDSHGSGNSKKMVIVTEDDDGKTVKKVMIFKGDGEHGHPDAYHDMQWTDESGKKHKMKVITEDVEITNDGSGENTVIRKIRIMVTDAERQDIPTSLKANEGKPLKDIALDVYPNPAGDEITVAFELKEKGTALVTLTDMAGKVIYTESLKNFSGKYEKKMSLQGNSEGIYLLQVVQNGKSVTKKIVKK